MQPNVKVTEAALLCWKFRFEDSGIANSKEIETVGNQLQLFQTPTIIFSRNKVTLTHECGFQLSFTAKEALKFINFKQRQVHLYALEKADDVPINHIVYLPGKVQIKHAKHWKTLKKPSDIELTELEEVSDSFFVTPYKGTVTSHNARIQRTKEDVIPLHKLGQDNQMKFYHQGMFYEDQLNDNGVTHYEYKFRHMKNSWFALLRCYLRVDDVEVHILDTRLYWEESFGKKVARQFMVKKSTWQQIQLKGFNVGGGWSTNPHQSHMVYPHLEVVTVDNEYIVFE